jgi:hypothetical protein
LLQTLVTNGERPLNVLREEETACRSTPGDPENAFAVSRDARRIVAGALSGKVFRVCADRANAPRTTACSRRC